MYYIYNDIASVIIGTKCDIIEKFLLLNSSLNINLKTMKFSKYMVHLTLFE